MSQSSKTAKPLRDRLQSDRCAKALKALADPDRLKLVQCLQERPHTVGELAERVESSLANVSHHLGVLRHAGLVCNKKSGKYVAYSLDPQVFRSGEGHAPDAMDLGCCRLDLRPQT